MKLLILVLKLLYKNSIQRLLHKHVYYKEKLYGMAGATSPHAYHRKSHHRCTVEVIQRHTIQSHFNRHLVYEPLLHSCVCIFAVNSKRYAPICRGSLIAAIYQR